MTNTRAMVPEPTKAIVEYGDWTPEQMDDEARELGNDGEYWKPPVGSTTIRVLPPKVGWKGPFTIQHQHFVRLPGVEHPVSFCCPLVHAKLECAVCARREQLLATGNKRDAKQAEDLHPQRRVLANIIVGPKDPNAKVKIWGFGKTVYQMLKQIRENEEAGGNFLDPKRGFNLSVTRVGTTKETTKYTVAASRQTSALANMDWINQQVDLKTKIRLPTLEQQHRLLEGEDPRDVWADDDSARDDSRGSRSRRRDEDVIDADGVERRSAEDDAFDDEVDVD